jgi:phospholipase A-2-activating protein
MYPDEIAAIDEAFAYLSQLPEGARRSTTVTSLTATHVEAIIQVLERWPTSQRFPGMFVNLS